MFINCPYCGFLVALDAQGQPLPRCPNCARRLRDEPAAPSPPKVDASPAPVAQAQVAPPAHATAAAGEPHTGEETLRYDDEHGIEAPLVASRTVRAGGDVIVIPASAGSENRPADATTSSADQAAPAVDALSSGPVERPERLDRPSVEPTPLPHPRLEPPQLRLPPPDRRSTALPVPLAVAQAPLAVRKPVPESLPQTVTAPPAYATAPEQAQQHSRNDTADPVSPGQSEPKPSAQAPAAAGELLPGRESGLNVSAAKAAVAPAGKAASTVRAFDAAAVIASMPSASSSVAQAPEPVAPDGDTSSDAVVTPPVAPRPTVHPREPTAPSFARRASLPAPIDRRRRRFERVAIAALTLLLALQLLVADRTRLAGDARWRPLLASVCGALHCALPPWREPRAFRVIERDIRATTPGALRVTARVRNEARWPQPWPALQLTLSDANGRDVATRVFQPREYLGGVPTQSQLGSGQSAALSMDIVEPGPQAVAFAFAFK